MDARLRSAEPFGQIAVQRREPAVAPLVPVDGVMVDDRRHDPDPPICAGHDLHDASLARPVDHRTGRDLPEAGGAPARVGAGPHPVLVTVPAQPGDDVAMTVQLLAESPIAMDEGLRFAIREGGRTVGSGVVSKILK